MARFLQQFDVGSGDYTRNRKEWLKDLSVRSVVGEVKSQRKGVIGIRLMKRSSLVCTDSCPQSLAGNMWRETA